MVLPADTHIKAFDDDDYHEWGKSDRNDHEKLIITQRERPRRCMPRLVPDDNEWVREWNTHPLGARQAFI